MGAARLKGLWERHKAAAFPPGAITFHLRAWSRGGLDREGSSAAGALIARHAFDHLLVLHGNALEVDGSLAVVAGPSCVGKSTVCRRLVRHRGARLVEDGLVLVGVSRTAWTVIETGTVGILARASRVGRVLRRITGAGRSLYREREVRSSTRRRSVNRRLAGELPFSLAVLLTVSGGAGFSPFLQRLDRLVVLEHPAAPAETFRIAHDGGMEAVPDPAAGVPRHVEVTRLSSVGGRRGVQSAMVAAILGPARAPGRAVV